jgi:hypothetical protein
MWISYVPEIDSDHPRVGVWRSDGHVVKLGTKADGHDQTSGSGNGRAECDRPAPQRMRETASPSWWSVRTSKTSVHTRR